MNEVQLARIALITTCLGLVALYFLGLPEFAEDLSPDLRGEVTQLYYTKNATMLKIHTCDVVSVYMPLHINQSFETQDVDVWGEYSDDLFIAEQVALVE